MSNKARFCYNNWLYSGSFSVSSSQSAYPSSNLVEQLRSPVWKPDGLFEITASNNVVYIAATSFTVPVGSYSFSTLATAFATASAGLSLTLSREASGLIKITKSGSTTYKLSTTTNAIWNTLGFFSTTDVTAATVTADERAYHTSEWIKVDNGIAQVPDFAALIPENGSPFSIGSSGLIYLQANNVDVWDAPAYSELMQVDGVGAFIAPQDPGSYRYVRIKIVDPTNDSIEIAVAYIGSAYIPENTNISTGFQRVSTDFSVRQRSESGAQYIDSRPKITALNNTQTLLLKEDDLDDLEQLMYDLGAVGNFFIVLDPSTQVSTRLSKYTYYVNLDGPAQFQHVLNNYHNCSFQLVEVV